MIREEIVNLMDDAIQTIYRLIRTQRSSVLTETGGTREVKVRRILAANSCFEAVKLIPAYLLRT